MRRLTAPGGGAAAAAAKRYKGVVRWLLFVPLVVWLHLNLMFAWVTHANPFAGSPSAIERLVSLTDPFADLRWFEAQAERGGALLRGGGHPLSPRVCRTVLVPRAVTQPTLVLGDDGQLRVEDRKVRELHQLKRCR